MERVSKLNKLENVIIVVPLDAWLKTFGILNILMIFILPLNFLIGKGSNYMYLYEAPQIKNPLVFGDWPYYIINWEIIIIVLFYVTYLIFTRKKI